MNKFHKPVVRINGKLLKSAFQIKVNEPIESCIKNVQINGTNTVRFSKIYGTVKFDVKRSPVDDNRFNEIYDRGDKNRVYLKINGTKIICHKCSLASIPTNLDTDDYYQYEFYCERMSLKKNIARPDIPSTGCIVKDGL
jgi:hypothetical protein